MALTEPVARKHMHTRNVQCFGYQRDDGLWDIEGHLVDTKTYGFSSTDRGEVTAGEPVHDMWLRLTIDKHYLIHDAEATTDWGPFNICSNITTQFRNLRGLTIAPGWNREVNKRVGGVKGCTHLLELLRPLATTAFQTLVSEKNDHDPRTGRNPRFLDTCHALARDSVVVKTHWPEFYSGKDDKRSD